VCVKDGNREHISSKLYTYALYCSVSAVTPGVSTASVEGKGCSSANTKLRDTSGPCCAQQVAGLSLAKVLTACCCGLQLGKGCLYAACLFTVRYAVVIYLFIVAQVAPRLCWCWSAGTRANSMWVCLPLCL
jgi:hypothetical protein